MDFSFEKTHSAYMLFYEHCQLDNEDRLPKTISIPRELQEQIWADSYQFFQDKLVYDPTYFNFIWAFCHHVPRTIEKDVLFHTFKLSCSFVLETLVHSREKMNMKGINLSKNFPILLSLYHVNFQANPLTDSFQNFDQIKLKFGCIAHTPSIGNSCIVVPSKR